MLETLRSLLWLWLMVLAAYGVGRPAAAALLPRSLDALGRRLWSVALGLLVYGTALAVLGLAGLLFAPLLGGLTLLGDAAAVAQLRAAVRRPRNDATCYHEPAVDCSGELPNTPPRQVLVGVLILSLCVAGASLVSALAPPTAGDALCYHLELPKRFLLDRAIRFLPYSENCTYPLLTEMWYLWGLALDGPVAAQLMHWLAGVLLCFAAVWFARPMLGVRWAWVAGCVVLLVPGVNNQMTAPLSDVALAFWTTLALAALWRAVTPPYDHRYWLPAGLAAGGALATKYTAFLVAAAATVWLTGALARHAAIGRKLLPAAVAAAIVAASVSGIWYVRAAWFRGNPVYPFFHRALSGSADESPGEVRPANDKRPLQMRLGQVVGGVWAVTMQPERFGGRSHQLGVLFLAAVPGLLLGPRPRWAIPLLGFCAVYWLLWLALQQNVRFLLPVVPVLAAATVWVFSCVQAMPGIPRWVAAGALAGLLAANAAIAVRRASAHWAVALGVESRTQYLARCEPTWLAASMLADCADRRTHLLSQDYRAFYFPVRVTRENVFRRQIPYHKAVCSPGDLSHVLRQLGFTHVLLVENQSGCGITFDPLLAQLVDRQLQSPQADRLVLKTQYQFRDSEGAIRQYRLLELR